MATLGGFLRVTRASVTAARHTVARSMGAVSAEKTGTLEKKASNSGLMKVTPVSYALQNFVGVAEISRVGALKKVWEYIKLQNLQNPSNKKEILCDAKLKKLFDGKDKVGMLEIAKLLSPHFVKA